MANEEERQQRNREQSNVIPYDRSLTSHRQDDEPKTTDDVGRPLDSPTPIGANDLDPDDIFSERNVEAAQEISEPLPRRETVERDEGDGDDGAEVGNGLGITALILSLVSIFFLPAVLGSAGIIVGFIAFRTGARTTGAWAMVIGAFSLMMALFVLPAYFR